MKRKWGNYVGAAKKAWKGATALYGGYKAGKKVYNGVKGKNKKQLYFTKVLKKKSSQDIGNQLAGGVQRVFARRNRVPRGMRVVLKNLALRRRINFNSNRITSSVGTQGSAFNPLCYRTDIESIVADNSLLDGQKIFLRNSKAHTMFTNQTNGVVIMTIYTMIPRVNCGSSEDPVTMWGTGNDNEGTDSNALTYPGCKPFTSALFSKKYYVTNVKKVRLAAGQTHENICINYINKSYNVDTLATDYYDSKISVLQMYTVHGFPQNDSTTKTQISLGATAVDFISSYTIEYNILQDFTRTRTDTGSAYISGFTVGGLVMTFADTAAEASGVA